MSRRKICEGIAGASSERVTGAAGCRSPPFGAEPVRASRDLNGTFTSSKRCPCERPRACASFGARSQFFLTIFKKARRPRSNDMTRRISSAVALRVALTSLLVPALAQAQTRGPSSSQDPYVLPVAPGVKTVSILTVGDSPQGSSYRLVGIPDGLGIYSRSGPSFTLLMNHELPATAGIVRAHGQAGAFVSRWELRKRDFAVLSGEDLIQSATIVTGGPAFGRFCSGDLPSRFALSLLDPFAPDLYMNGEEVGAEGRAFAHVASGPEEGHSYELPALGKCSFENTV